MNQRREPAEAAERRGVNLDPCGCSILGRTDYPPRRIAYCRLHAAATAMQEVLQLVANLREENHPPPSGNTCALCEAIREARAILRSLDGA